MPRSFESLIPGDDALDYVMRRLLEIESVKWGWLLDVKNGITGGLPVRPDSMNVARLLFTPGLRCPVKHTWLTRPTVDLTPEGAIEVVFRSDDKRYAAIHVDCGSVVRITVRSATKSEEKIVRFDLGGTSPQASGLMELVRAVNGTLRWVVKPLLIMGKQHEARRQD